MKNLASLSRRQIYLLLSLAILVSVGFGFSRYNIGHPETPPKVGDWVYMNCGKNDLLSDYSGRPGKLNSKGDRDDFVDYHLINSKALNIAVPHKISLHRCPGQLNVNDHWMGVIRIWKGSESRLLRDQTEHDAQVGDKVTVEIKNFGLWLFQQFDFGRLKAELTDIPEYIPADVAAIVRGAVQGRGAEDLLIAINHVDTALRNDLLTGKSDSKPADIWKDLLAYIDSNAILKEVASAMPEAESVSVHDPFTPENVEKVRRRFLPIKVWASAVAEKKFKQLTLTFNGIPLVGLKAKNAYNEAEVTHEKRPSFQEDTYQWARFVLERRDISSNAGEDDSDDARQLEAAWSKLIGKPAFYLHTNVTLRLPEDGLEVPTKVTFQPQDPENRFDLIGIRVWLFIPTIIVFLFILAFLVWLAKTTNILRDSSGRVRADGLEPVSLGRTQMAFWFILTAFAYAFLWVTTSNHNCINNTCLILMGIGSGTALGSALIEKASPKFLFTTTLGAPRGSILLGIVNAILIRMQDAALLLTSQDSESRVHFLTILRALKRDITGSTSGASEEIDALLGSLTGWGLDGKLDEIKIKPDVNTAIISFAKSLKVKDQGALGVDEKQATTIGPMEELANELKLLGAQYVAFQTMPTTAWKRLFSDWLSEGFSNEYSLHRFQMLAWTLLLGFVFMAKVLNERVMPQFNTLTLAVLGISAGTYLGFKVPAVK